MFSFFLSAGLIIDSARERTNFNEGTNEEHHPGKRNQSMQNAGLTCCTHSIVHSSHPLLPFVWAWMAQVFQPAKDLKRSALKLDRVGE